MQITKEVSGTSATICPVGKITVQTAPELEAAIGALGSGVSDVAIDLTGVDYISSAGLRVLVGAEKLLRSRGGALRLQHPAEAVNEVFEMTGLNTVLTIEA